MIAQNHHKKILFYRSTPFNGDKKNIVSRHFRLLNPYQQIQGKSKSRVFRRKAEQRMALISSLEFFPKITLDDGPKKSPKRVKLSSELFFNNDALAMNEFRIN